MKDTRYWEAIQAQEEREEQERWESKCEWEQEQSRRLQEKQKQKKIWTEEEIKSLIQTNDKVLYGALKKLYAEQTADEQRAECTRERNGAGFNSIDAQFLSSVAQFLIRAGFLTEKQKAATRRKLVKYNKQLTRLANA